MEYMQDHGLVLVASKQDKGNAFNLFNAKHAFFIPVYLKWLFR